MFENRILLGDNIDTLKTLPDKSVDCCVTSPPYYLLRDYAGIDKQIGMENTPEEYIDRLVGVFSEVRRVLKDTGTLWVNIGDTWAGSGKGYQGRREYLNGAMPKKVFTSDTMKPKMLLGIPWRFALAMQKDWILRQDIVWAKSNPMPEPCKDRFCKSHEFVFLFSKQGNYYFDHDAALEEAIGYDGRGVTATYENQDYLISTENHKPGTRRPRWAQRGYATKPNDENLFPQYHGENIVTTPLRTKRDVWFISTEASMENHYAMFPEKLILPCIKCGCPQNGIVLDPFIGSGTTAIVAMKLLRKFIGCEINPEYVQIAEKRIALNKTLFDEEEE